MDLKNFRKIGEDQHSYTVQHPSGKKLFIEKAKLSEKSHKAIQCLSDGGEASDNGISDVKIGDDAALGASADPAEAQAERDPAGLPADYQNKFSRDPAAGPVLSDQEKADIATIPQQDPLLEQKTGSQQLLGQQQAEQEQALAATQAAQQDVAKVQEATGNKLNMIPSDYATWANHQEKDAQLEKDFHDAKIDPQRLMHNRSTPSKIIGGIGLILSGMGSAMAGQPNYAMEAMNRAIDQDIDAQKNDQTNKMNLWKMNRENTKTEQEANLATKNQLLTSAQFQLQAAQTRATLPVEKLRAQQAIDGIKQQKLQNNMMRELLGQGQAGGGAGSLSRVDPAVMVPEMIKDPGQQKMALEEIKNRANITKNGAEMLKAFDQAAKEVSGVGGTIHSAIERSPGQLQLEQLMKPNMSELDGTIRHEAVVGANETMIPNYKDLGRADRIAAKRQSLINWMESQKSAPVSKSNLLDLDRYASTAIPHTPAPQAAAAAPQAVKITPENKVYLDWAKKNPGNPKAQAVLKKFGVK